MSVPAEVTHARDPSSRIDRARATARWNVTRLGEPGSLSLLATAMYVPFGLSGPLLIDTARLGGSAWAWLGIALLGQLVLMVAYVIARWVIHGRAGSATRSRPIATVIAILIAVVLRGVVLALVPMALGLTNDPGWGYRLISGPFAQGGALIILGLVVSVTRYHSGIAAELARTRESTLSINASMRERLQEIEADLAMQVRRTVDPLLRDLDETLERASDGDSQAVRVAIRSLVDDELRPLSAQLASGAATDLPEPAAASVRARVPLPERMAMADLLRPWSMAFLAGLAALSQSMRGLQFPVTVLFPLATMVVIGPITWLLRSLLGHWRPRLAIGITAAIACGAVGFVSTLALLIAVGMPLPWDLGRAAIAVGGIWGGLLAGYEAVTARREATEEQLRASIEALREATSVLRRRSYVASRQLSYVIHGSLQSALHAAAMRLASNERPDTATITAIRRDIASAAEKLDLASSPYSRLVSALDDLTELWDGTCTVRWTMDHRTVRTLVGSPDAAIAVAEISRELVTNAIKHGGATDIWMTIGEAGDRVVVTSLDNGRGLGREIGGGLGSRMLDELCVSWAREPAEPSGVRVVAEVSAASA